MFWYGSTKSKNNHFVLLHQHNYLTHNTLFNGHFPGKPGLASFSLQGFEAISCTLILFIHSDFGTL